MLFQFLSVNHQIIRHRRVGAAVATATASEPWGKTRRCQTRTMAAKPGLQYPTNGNVTHPVSPSALSFTTCPLTYWLHRTDELTLITRQVYEKMAVFWLPVPRNLKNIPTFQKCLLSPSSGRWGWWRGQQAPLTNWWSLPVHTVQPRRQPAAY